MLNGELLLGCEDELPFMGRHSSPGTAGAYDPFNPGTNGSDTKVISLATYGEIQQWPSVSTTYSFDPGWWDSLDDPEDSQAYLISWDSENDRILIVGATALGLKMGVIDWFKSLEQVNFSGTGPWNPDDRGGSVATCSGYSNATGSDAAVWDNTGKTWTAVESLEWCPERVVNYPDIDVRMANPAHNALDGSGGTFLGSFLSRATTEPGCAGPASGGGSLHPTACCSTSTHWMETVVEDCDRGDPSCHEQITRLDGLVAGNFTHVIDQSNPWMVRDTVPQECRLGSVTNRELYGELNDYLGDRGVQLVATAYGWETNGGDNPVMGTTDGVAGGWTGQEGNPLLQEGFSIYDKAMEVCATTDGRLFLAPVPEVGDDYDNGLDPCDYIDDANGEPNVGSSGSGFVNPVPLRVSGSVAGIHSLATVSWRPSLPPEFKLHSILEGSTGMEGWGDSTVSGVHRYAPLAGGANNSQTMALRLPLSGSTSERVFIIDFDAYANTAATGLDATITARVEAHTTDPGYPRDLESASYEIGKTDNANRYPGASAGDAQHYSLTVRVPANASITSESWVEFNTDDGAAGSSGNLGVWMDSVRVTELDGLLLQCRTR